MNAEWTNLPIWNGDKVKQDGQTYHRQLQFIKETIRAGMIIYPEINLPPLELRINGGVYDKTANQVILKPPKIQRAELVLSP